MYLHGNATQPLPRKDGGGFCRHFPSMREIMLHEDTRVHVHTQHSREHSVLIMF